MSGKVKWTVGFLSKQEETGWFNLIADKPAFIPALLLLAIDKERFVSLTVCFIEMILREYEDIFKEEFVLTSKERLEIMAEDLLCVIYVRQYKNRYVFKTDLKKFRKVLIKSQSN